MAHSFPRLSLILATWISYVAFLVLVVLNISKTAPEWTFTTDLLTQSSKYPLTFSSATWTYYIYVPIWIWQITWLVYVITAIFRKTVSADGVYIYQMDIVSNGVYWSFIIADIMLIAWLFFFDNDMLIVSTVALLFTTCSLASGLCLAHRNINRLIDVFQKNGVERDVWIVRALLHNGGMSYFVVISVGLLTEFGMILTYECGIGSDVSTYIILSCLSVEIFVWFCLDVSIFDKYVRYTVTPYFVADYLIIGTMTQEFNLLEQPKLSVYLASLVSVLCLMTITKVILVAWRHRNYPIRSQYRYDVNNGDVTNGIV